MPSSHIRAGVLALALLAGAPAGAAAQSTGGAAAFEPPSIAEVRCIPSPEAACVDERTAPAGSQIQVRGKDLHSVRAVTFRGRAGTEDDVTVRPRHVRPTHVEAVVPEAARSGKLELRARGHRVVSRAAVKVVSAPAPTELTSSSSAEQVFPIRGKHDLGQSQTNNFGGGRNHKGQDLFAACGTPLVAAEGGKVKYAATQERAGNYVVITGASTKRDYVYMHMRRPSLVAKGALVTAGQRIGDVGDTGNASGCHLHFELWSAPGWYDGGSVLDPLPDLRAWDRLDGRHRH